MKLLVLAAQALLVLAAAGSETPATAGSETPLFSFGDESPIVELNDSNFDSVVVKDSAHIWIVKFYADWCGHCKKFAKGYEKVANNLKGIIKFGAVNGETSKKLASQLGLKGYPAIKLFPIEKSQNPFTGETIKVPVDYSGARTAKALVQFATEKLPSTVITVTDANLDKFSVNGSLPKAILLTKKTETTALFKSLSLLLNGRMIVGEARDTETAVVDKFGATEFPALFVVGADGAPALKYEGELKPEALTAFLEEHAAAKPEALDDGPFERVDASNYVELVESVDDAWLLVFGSLPAPGVSGLGESVFKQVKVGLVGADDGSFRKRFNVKAGESAVVLVPYGDKSKLKKYTKMAATEAGVTAARKAALESLPTTAVQLLQTEMVDTWMAVSMQEGSRFAAKAICILFTDKPSVPALYRSVSLAFKETLAFGMVQSNDEALMKRFGIDKVPALLILYPVPDVEKNAEDGTKEAMQLSGQRYDPNAHGPFKYGYVANFVGQMAAQRMKTLGVESKEEEYDPTKGMKGMKKDLGPVPELSRSTFADACETAGGLCAIVMLDGAQENTNKQTHLDMVTTMRKKRHGGPLAFSWLDATCHSAFAAAFSIYETDLPTMVVYSPSKKRWARSVGAFDAASLGAFGTGVATGRIRTDELTEAPPQMEEVDCTTLPRGADAVIDEEPLDDDFMAEILEEERKAREERESSVVVEPQGKVKPKNKDSMNKLEKLVAEVEECGSMDLLCAARREKQMKAVEKQTSLEEKLKEIAKKKKKKAKKAAKKAAA